MEKNGRESGNGVTLSGVWKVATFILGYLIMGVWITAQISEGNKSLASAVQDVKQDVRRISDRLDRHIDNQQQKGP